MRFSAFPDILCHDKFGWLVQVIIVKADAECFCNWTTAKTKMRQTGFYKNRDVRNQKQKGTYILRPFYSTKKVLVKSIVRWDSEDIFIYLCWWSIGLQRKKKKWNQYSEKSFNHNQLVWGGGEKTPTKKSVYKLAVYFLK